MASLEQVSFRVRNDDGSETTATWVERAGLGTVQECDATFRVRFTLRNYHASASESTGFKLQYRRPAGTNAWTDVTSSSDVVIALASSNVTDGDATTDQLGGLSGSTFVAGTIDEVDGAWASVTLAANRYTELEAVLQLVEADLVDGDQVLLRVVRAAGTVLDRYRRLVPLTASIPASETFLSDTMNRSASSGWGDADGGTDTVKTWTIINGTAGDLSCNGSVCLNATGFGLTRLRTGDDNSDNVDVLARFLDINNTMNEFRDLGIFCRSDTAGNSYTLNLKGTGSTDYTLYLQEWGGSVFASTIVTYFANAWFRLQAETSGGDVILRAKYWQDGAGEPGTWTLTHTDSSTPRTSGRYGALITNQSDTLDTKIDSFVVTSLGGGALPAAKPVATESRLYGVHHDRIYFGTGDEFHLDSFNRAQAAKAQICRHLFLWHIIEPSDGALDWSRPDSVLSLSEARGIRTMFTIAGSPTWANGGSNEWDIPNFDAAPQTAWDAWLADYAAFVTAAVTRYADRNILWEMWNEPNLQGFWDSTNSQTSGQDTAGWMDEYKEWHDTIRAAILAVDPHARIAAPTISTWRYIGANQIPGDDFLDGLITRGIVLDAVSFHVYDNDAPDDSTTAFENHHTDVDHNSDGQGPHLRASLVAQGLDNVPIWFTEFGWDIGNTAATEAEQATFVTTAHEQIRDDFTYVEASCYFLLEATASFTGHGLYEQATGYAPRDSRDAFAAFIDTIAPPRKFILTRPA